MPFMNCKSIVGSRHSIKSGRSSQPLLRRRGITLLAISVGLVASALATVSAATTPELPRIQIAPDARGFVTSDGRPFIPFGVNYYRPGTGWAPQVWKQFDAAATRADFQRMKAAGVNCVRVFLSFGSFYSTPGQLDAAGLAKFDEFLQIAEANGIYVHPTGPDHWEGLPDWAKPDRYADEAFLAALEQFWSAFAARYRDRQVIFAYDLLNEPQVPWDTPALRVKWNDWLKRQYDSMANVTQAWGRINLPAFGAFTPPPAQPSPGSRELRDYQSFRESIADEWTRRQVVALKAADPQALVTVGLVQWSVPSLLPSVKHYAAFHPGRQARFLDFMEIHFYPLDRGAFEYRDAGEENRNLAYLHSVVSEVAKTGKPVIVAEFGWYGGGQPRFDQGRHPFASEAQQAQWCRRLIETTTGLACGWLNWGFYDQPEATDVSELTGLYQADGTIKAWGREFQQLARRFTTEGLPRTAPQVRADLDWNDCVTDPAAGHRWRDEYFKRFTAATPPTNPPATDRVIAFYYPWYGNPTRDGRYANWNHPVAVRNEPPRAFPGGADIGADFYPALGCYSVNDPEVLQEHVRQLKQAGVGTISVSWWGRDTFTDRALPALFQVAEATGLKINFHLEPFPGRNATTTREAVVYLLEKFGDSPALQRLASHDQRPVFFVYDSYLTPVSDWATLLQPNGQQTLRGTPFDAVVIGLWVKEREEQFMTDGGFDGFYTYFATDGFTYGSTVKNWPQLMEWARAHGKLFIPCVAPGYIDTRIRPWNGGNTRDREGDAYYDRMWTAALNVTPELVAITSFNEWHEGTQIERAMPKWIPSFTYLDYQPLAADHYLERTADWVRRLLQTP